MKRKKGVLIKALLAVLVLFFLLFLLLNNGSVLRVVYRLLGVPYGESPNETKADSQSGVIDITFMYVGQGDGFLIEADGYTALIDCGTADSYGHIYNALLKRGITRLDSIYISHPHTDHMGSLRDILLNFEVGQLYFTDVPMDLTPTNSTYERMLDVVEQKKIPVSILHEGDRQIILTDSDTHPAAYITTLISGAGQDLNNCSAVLKFEYGTGSVLFMGDAEGSIESKLIKSGLDLSADILKVGHHGTKKATYDDFLAAVKPTYAVISCGQDNDYGYPKQKVLDRLAKCGADVLRTDLLGDITFSFDGSGYKLISEDGE